MNELITAASLDQSACENGLEQTGKIADFSMLVQRYERELRQFCRSLTGSTWEGDDLAQDTWLKVWSAASSKADTLTRAYLYRTARNAWIDRNRKKELPIQNASPNDLLSSGESDSLKLWAALELLVSELVPNQRTVLLLVDVLLYTAGEAAELMQTTEGAVKAALHRGRAKLARLAFSKSLSEKETGRKRREIDSESSELLVYAYLEAFRRQDALALVLLLNNSETKLAPILTLPSDRHAAREHPPRTRSSSLIQSQINVFSKSYAA